MQHCVNFLECEFQDQDIPEITCETESWKLVCKSMATEFLKEERRCFVGVLRSSQCSYLAAFARRGCPTEWDSTIGQATRQSVESLEEAICCQKLWILV